MTNHSQQIVQKLWNYCNVLRDDGMSYGDYVEQEIETERGQIFNLERSSLRASAAHHSTLRQQHQN